MLTVAEKEQIVKTYQTKPGDTGSSEVQIALFSADIAKLTEHFKTHKHDHHSRRGLHYKVNQRRKLLKYLKGVDIARYRHIIKALGLRDIVSD